MVLNRDRNLYLPLAAKLLCQQLAIQQYSRCHQHDSILCVFDSLKLSACDDASGTTTTLGKKSLENSHSASSLDFFMVISSCTIRQLATFFGVGGRAFPALTIILLQQKLMHQQLLTRQHSSFMLLGCQHSGKASFCISENRALKLLHMYMSTRIHPKYVEAM